MTGDVIEWCCKAALWWKMTLREGCVYVRVHMYGEKVGNYCCGQEVGMARHTTHISSSPGDTREVHSTSCLNELSYRGKESHSHTSQYVRMTYSPSTLTQIEHYCTQNITQRCTHKHTHTHPPHIHTHTQHIQTLTSAWWGFPLLVGLWWGDGRQWSECSMNT